jgi:hypothetical protein
LRGDIECSDHRCAAPRGTADDSGCGRDLMADDCGLYAAVFCTGEAKQKAPRCANSCERDEECDSEAHCDGTCILDAPNGQACDENSDCVAGHCQNGHCCTGGDCCSAPSDCPMSYASAPVCDDPTRCQGSRSNATCEQNVCASAKADDDSACAGKLADTCGAAVDSLCTAEVEQPGMRCKASCMADSDCDVSAHCEAGTCAADVPNGGACGANSACTSGHCQNGFCCENGDCCASARNCPARYQPPPVCADLQACTGYRFEATCSYSSCWIRPIPDVRPCGLCQPLPNFDPR